MYEVGFLCTNIGQQTIKYSFISDCNGTQYSLIGEIESPGYPVMPKTAVTCERKLSLSTLSLYYTYVTYQFSVFDMASCQDVELQVRNIVHNIIATSKYGY